MMKFVLSFAATMLFSCAALAQEQAAFSEDPPTFLLQLQQWVQTDNEPRAMEAFQTFSGSYAGGLFTAAEMSQVIEHCNAMARQKLPVAPVLSNYLANLPLVKKSADATQNVFANWQQTLSKLIASATRQDYRTLDAFLRFNLDFMASRSLKNSGPGATWMVFSEQFDYGLDAGNGPFLRFDKLDLVAFSSRDSFAINGTSGRFFPLSTTWEGQGGRVDWLRAGLDEDVYATLEDYTLDTGKDAYEAPAMLHYPLYFGIKPVKGTLSDRLMAPIPGVAKSYPRFESADSYMQMDDIGQGVTFSGGFRLYGGTVYGYGTADQQAVVVIAFPGSNTRFEGRAENLTLQREQRVFGEQVAATIVIGQDSIYHPAARIDFDMTRRTLDLSRGEVGKAQNPFFSSFHQLNWYADKMTLYFDQDSLAIGEKASPVEKTRELTLESPGYFNKSDYLRIQNIASTHPLAVMKRMAETENTRMLDADRYAMALNPKFRANTIQSLLFDLVGQGFIYYEKEKTAIEVRDKVFHYAEADRGQRDYDYFRFTSRSATTNGFLDLKTRTLQVDGVDNLEWSRRQRVAANFAGSQVLLQGNRNLDFDGRLFAGFSVLEGKDFHFIYDKYWIVLDSVRYFDLFVPDPDKGDMQSIGSRLEHFSGILLIDAPSNKSGRLDVDMFPSLHTRSPAYVYYDRDTTLGFDRDSFYFEVAPFHFNNLDQYSPDAVAFQGSLQSAGIFPDFGETLRLQDDQSLGFSSTTPDTGLPLFGGKGTYKGQIQLDNKGLAGVGSFAYLGATVASEDIRFKKEQLTASADEFSLEEDRVSEIQVPQVRGEDVRIDWRPYQDSLYVNAAGKPFDLFQSGEHTLSGKLILTPGGLKGDGVLDWSKASLRSAQFSFAANSVSADTTNVAIKASTEGALALETSNVSGKVDFDTQLASFEANASQLTTLLPYNQYQTTMNEFDWEMEDKRVIFRAREGQPGSFLSTDPIREALSFEAQTAYYDLETSELKTNGVPWIIAADAFIYPDSGRVDISPGGKMSTLLNARIVADTLNQNHTINRATVEIDGRKHYTAKGFYEYNIGDKQQEIEFSDIIGTRVGPGKIEFRRVETRAMGTVKEEDDFFIDQKTRFKGAIQLSAANKNLLFDGFALLDADKLPEKYWFTVKSEGDKNDLSIAYLKPFTEAGEPVETGLFLSRETGQAYPRVMMPLSYRRDRPIIPVTGYFTYNDARDQFVFGDSVKVFAKGLTGNLLTFDNTTGNVQMEGKFNIGSGLSYVDIKAAGTAKTAFPPPQPKVERDENMMAADEVKFDSTLLIPTPPTTADLMMAIPLTVPDELLKIMINDLKSSSFDAPNITYLNDINFYKKAALEIFPNTEEVVQAVNDITFGFLDIPAKVNPYTFLFGRLNMRWDPEYQSFITTSAKNGLTSVQGEAIHKVITAHIECRMPSNNDDRLYIYIKSPSELYYYFEYRQGVLSLISNNPRFMEAFDKIKPADRVIKMPDGETYEITDIAPTRASLFVRRVESAGK
ncbi:MAG: hypothetical protein NWS63_06400 [Saprospiraceae bacterium]|nr:hypothetical protein [Saprospiraceae bacterium]